MGKKQMGNGEPALASAPNGNGMGTLGDKLLEAVEKKDNGEGEKDKKKKGESIEKRISGGLKIAKSLLSKMEEMYKYHLSRGEEVSFSNGEIPFDKEFVSGFVDSISEAEKGDKNEKNIEELGGCIRELRRFVESEKPEIKIVDPSKMLDNIFSQDEFKEYLKKKSGRERVEGYKKDIIEGFGENMPADEIAFLAKAIEVLNSKKTKPKAVLTMLEKMQEKLDEKKKPKPIVEEKKEEPAPAEAKPDFKKPEPRAEDNIEAEKEKRKKSFESRYGANVIYEGKDVNGKTKRFVLVGLIPGETRKEDKVGTRELSSDEIEEKRTKEFFDYIDMDGFKMVMSVEEYEKSKNEEREKRRAEFEKEFGANVIYKKQKGKKTIKFTLLGYFPEEKKPIKIKEDTGKIAWWSEKYFRNIIIDEQGFKRELGANELKDNALAVLENANRKFMDFLAETAGQKDDPDMIKFRKGIRNAILEAADKLDQDDIPVDKLEGMILSMDNFLKIDLNEEFEKFKENEAKIVGEKLEDSSRVSKGKTDSGDDKKEDKAGVAEEISKEIEEKFRLYEIWIPTKNDVKESLRVVGYDKDSKGKEIFSVEFGKRDGLNFKKEKSTKISRKRLEGIMKEGGYRVLDISKAREIRSEKFKEKYGEDVWYIKYEDGLPVASFKVAEFRIGKVRSKDIVVIEGEDGEKKEISIKAFEELINEGYKMDNGINQALSDTRDADGIVRKNKLEEEKKAEVEALRKKAKGTGADKDDSPEESDNMPDREKGAEGSNGVLSTEDPVAIGDKIEKEMLTERKKKGKDRKDLSIEDVVKSIEEGMKAIEKEKDSVEFSEKEKKIMAGSEKIALDFVEDQKDAFDFENFPKGRLAQLLEIQAVKFLMDKFRARNIFSGKEEDVAEMIVGKIKDKF